MPQKKKLNKKNPKQGVTLPLKFPLDQVVIVDWTDACGSPGWGDREEFEAIDGIAVRSVGFLLRKDKRFITLMQTQSIEGGMNASITIPAGWVKMIHKIK